MVSNKGGNEGKSKNQHKTLRQGSKSYKLKFSVKIFPQNSFCFKIYH